MDSNLTPIMSANVAQPRAASATAKSEALPLPQMVNATFVDQNTSLGRRASAPSRFRRLRTGRACETCHARKVRCDAASLGIPCTNCIAFSMECKVPSRNKKEGAGRDMDNLKQQGGYPSPRRQSLVPARIQPMLVPESPLDAHSEPMAELKLEEEPEDSKYYAKLIKREVCEAPILESGQVVYLEESSNLALLVNDLKGPSGIVHYPMHESGVGCSMPEKMDKVELQLLQRRGALILPPRAVSDDLIKTYFKWVAPVMPIINKTRFMQQYRDPENPPSILLQQAVFLAASRACRNSQLMDSNGSTIPAATTFYKRAKALYESSYEDDRIANIQALILMGWYWEEEGKVTKNVFYWNGLAVTIAQGCGLHRNADESRLSTADKRLWKRIWWTLFTRDRSVAVALGRPSHINMANSDVVMLTEEDFVDEGNVQSAALLPGRLQVQFFLQYVKICEVMDLVLLQNFSISSKARRRNALGLTECDMALADWLQNCPQELRWERSRHHFWSALLFSVYHTTSCLLHRTHLPRAPISRQVRHGTRSESAIVPLRSPAFQAAHAITSIVEALLDENELRFSPPFLVYSLSSALLIHVYQLNVAMPTTDVAAQNRIRICMACLEQVSKVWLVAKMIHSLYEFILSEKGFGDTLKDGARKVRGSGGPRIEQKPYGPAQRQRKDIGPSKSSEKSDKRSESQSPTLTPALLAHMFAALKSGTSSSNVEKEDSRNDVLDINDDVSNQKPPHLADVTCDEIYNPYLAFDAQSVPQVPYQFEEERRSEPIPPQPPVNMHMSQYIPQQLPAENNPEMYTGLQTMTMDNLSFQGLTIPQNQGYMQNVVDRSQYLPSEVGELQHGHPVNQLGYDLNDPYYTSINDTVYQLPASTGPNLLEWIQYFGIGNYQ